MPFELSLSPTPVQVQAGQSAELTVTVRSLAEAEEEYTVTVLGLDASVYRLLQPSVRVAAGQTGQLSVVLCPPAGGNIRTATYTFRVRVAAGGGEQKTETASVTIEPALALKLELLPTGRGRFDVSLSSEASCDLEVDLKAEDRSGAGPARSCDFFLEHAQVRLRQGESARVPLRVQPRRRSVFGLGQSHPFVVSATPAIRNARSEAVEGLARSAALVPWWVLLLLLVAIAAGVFALMGQPHGSKSGRAPERGPAGMARAALAWTNSATDDERLQSVGPAAIMESGQIEPDTFGRATRMKSPRHGSSIGRRISCAIIPVRQWTFSISYNTEPWRIRRLSPRRRRAPPQVRRRSRNAGKRSK
jgi:hypothetical protein